MAYKAITDQQLRLYMTDLQNHSQRTEAARPWFSANEPPPISILGFDADPIPPSKRKIAHGRTGKGPLERW